MALRSGLGGRRSQPPAEPPVAPAPPPRPAFARPPRPPAGPVDVVVEAACAPGDVIPWFLDAHRWTRFQGRAARVDPVVDGAIRLELGDGVVVTGRFLDLAPDRVAFTWGRPGDPLLPPDGSKVTVLATGLATGGTEILLRHEGLPDVGVAEAHRSGWRYHMTRLAVVATGATAETETVELFLAASSEADPDARRGLLERTCTAEIEVADDAGRVTGIPALADHFGRGASASPTRRLVRTGPVHRVGGILRCPYAVVDRRVGGTTELEDGEIVAAVDRSSKLTALSLFG